MLRDERAEVDWPDSCSTTARVDRRSGLPAEDIANNMLKSREERERERERRAVEHLAVDYRAQHSLLDARDTQIDGTLDPRCPTASYQSHPLLPALCVRSCSCYGKGALALALHTASSLTGFVRSQARPQTAPSPFPLPRHPQT